MCVQFDACIPPDESARELRARLPTGDIAIVPMRKCRRHNALSGSPKATTPGSMHGAVPIAEGGGDELRDGQLASEWELCDAGAIVMARLAVSRREVLCAE